MESLRLDKVVQNRIFQEYGILLSRNYVFKLLEMGGVKYNDEVIKRKGFKFSSLEEAQKIVIDQDMVKAVINEYKTGRISEKYAQMWQNSAPIGMFELRKEYIDKVNVKQDDIIFEDENFVVMYKPAGVVSHPTKMDAFEDSMIFRFLKYMKTVHDFMPRAGLVHRLDRETQGLLMFAKNMQAYNYLKEQFNNNQIIKLYLVAYFIPQNAYGRARPIIKLLKPANRKLLEMQGKEFFDNVLALQKVDINGYISMFRFKHKAAFVYQKKELKKRIFRQIKDARSFEYPGFVSKLNSHIGISFVHLITGRTHQIRAQHEYLGLPILNDNLYTPGGIAREYQRQIPEELKKRIANLSGSQGIKAIGLCAYGLSFYNMEQPSKRVYVTLPHNKLSFSSIL